MTTTDTLHFDPYAYELHEDPYPVYERLREEAPLYRNDELAIWVLSRHEDVLEGLRDAEKLSSAHGVSLDPTAVGPHSHKTASFLAMDPPRHGRMRAWCHGASPRDGCRTSNPASASSPASTWRRRWTAVASSTSSPTSPAGSRWTSSPR
ncbi:MAG: hypothetical protein R2726_17255 [Acidimicrobiales bacterium]